MYLSGFADEAAETIEGQINVTKKLGWKNIEVRNINKENIHDLPEKEFELVCEKLSEAKIEINCFGSTIANWGNQVTDPFENTLEMVRRTIPRMKRLGTKLIRIMSYAVLKDEKGKVLQNQMEEKRFYRLREICKMFNDAGIIPVHENCMNYGGMGWTQTLKILENVPGLKLVFDTGNPVSTDDYIKSKPYPKQSSWEFYSHVKEHIEYVHIKDKIFYSQTNSQKYTYPGEGDGDVARIVKDLYENGYDGGFSIEPHMAVVFHDKSVQAEDKVRIENYMEYGKRFMDLIEEIGYSIG